MSEVELGGHTYRVGRLSAHKQFHVMRRLALVLEAVSKSLTGMVEGAVGEEPPEAPNLTDILRTAAPIITAIGAMSDDQADYVINTCLSVVERRQVDGRTWTRVHGPNGLMFEDITLPTMMQLCWHVIQENLQSFFPGTAFGLAEGLGVVRLRA